ncbi:hypothetical protein FSOLCH5_011238 [Fusarium solani]
MRLINVRTMELEEFYGDQIPKYAILSHTWGQGEVTFQDWKDLDLASQKAGFVKILGACRQADKDLLEYLWMDTNCIDKTSSAELSEAINSMFAWYRDAEWPGPLYRLPQKSMVHTGMDPARASRATGGGLL